MLFLLFVMMIIYHIHKGCAFPCTWHLKWTLSNKIKSVIQLNPSETHWTIQFEAIENSLCPFKSNYDPVEREKSCLSNDQRVAPMKASISTELLNTANTMCLFLSTNYSSLFNGAGFKKVLDLQILKSAQFWPQWRRVKLVKMWKMQWLPPWGST